jgi:hypothetical protein
MDVTDDGAKQCLNYILAAEVPQRISPCVKGWTRRAGLRPGSKIKPWDNRCKKKEEATPRNSPLSQEI